MQIRIVAAADMKQAKAEFAALQAQVAALNEQMVRTTKIPGGVNPQGYQRLATALNEGSRAYRNSLASTGRFHVEQLRINSATETYTELLQKQKLSLRDLIKNQKVMKAAYREQLAIQQMVIRKTPSSLGDGRSTFDIAVPTEVSKELDTLNKRMGWYRAQLASAATQTVNWGKNTQWTGRQLMVGFTLPVAAFGAATGVMAYQVDKEMTRIEKVYDTAADGVTGSVSEMAEAERELAQLRKDSFNLAANAANSYGAAIQDTLAIEAELAATGLRGSELMKQTNEVMRIATLGEMEYTTALNASITAQSVFKMSADETADAFNYMNAVENATSLQLQDFAEALPIAAAPVQSFGGDIKELGILLTAMKQNGIAATQGANAIKASMQRLLRPSAQVRQEFAQMTGQDIVKLVEQGKSLTEVFQLIGKATEDLNDKDEGKVFAGLFGTYQVTRMRAMVEGMRDLEAGTGQVSAAAKAAQMDTVELAEAANNELNRWQRSASGRFKRAVELFKVQMAEMGEPFVAVGANVVEFITKVASAFNALPKIMKNGLAITAMLFAIAGPVIMLIGLFANLAGNIGKFASVLLGLVGRMNIMNKGQQAAALAAKMSESGLLSQASATQLLTEEVKLLTLSLHEAAKAQQLSMMQAAGATEAQMAAVRNRPAPMSAATRAAQSSTTADVSDGTAKASRNTRSMAVAGGVFAAAMAASAISSNEVVRNISNIAMIASGLAPVVSGIAAGFRSDTLRKFGRAFATNITWQILLAREAMGKLFVATTTWIKSIRAAGIAGAFSSLASGILGAGKALLGLLGPIGWTVAGLTAGGFAAYKLWQHSKKAREEVERTYNGAEQLAEIYGYMASDMGKVMGDDGEMVESTASRVNKFRESFEGLADKIRDAKTDQDKFNAAMIAGVNVINSGGTADQAKLAVHDAIAAAHDVATAERITLMFEAKMDFSNAEVVANAGIQKAVEAARDSLKDIDPSFGERFTNISPKQLADSILPFYNDVSGDISGTAKAAAENAGAALALSFAQGMEMEDGDGVISEALDTLLSQLEDYNKKIEKAQKEGNDALAERYQFIRDLFLQEFATDMGVEDSKKLVENLAQGGNALDLMGVYASKLTAEQRVQLMLTQENRSGWGNLVLGLNAAVAISEKYTNENKEANRELSEQERKQMRINAALEKRVGIFKGMNQGGEFKNAYRDAMSAVQDDIASMVVEGFEEDMQASLDATRAEGERRTERNRALEERENERFKSRWERRTEAVENHFDTRSKAVEDAIEAERKAEEIRKRLFDAEMKRISRLNEAANRNIDFNVALNTGDLDEAAKIRNDANAAATEWALADAGERASTRSERAVERLEARKDRLKEAKDERLQALKDREEAERKHLDKVQRMRADQLKREVDNDLKAQERIWKSRRSNLDDSVKYLKNIVALNEKDLKAHIGRTEGKYEEFGKQIKKQAGGWSSIIEDRLFAHVQSASDRMKSDIKWEAMGRNAANKMLAGALGMTWKQFREWMVDGSWPVDVSKKRGINPDTGRPYNSSEGHRARHTGGWINDSKGSRKGYARNAPMHRNERMILAEKGEYMINKHSAAKYAPIIDSINNDTYGKNEGPGVGGAGVGFGGLMAAVVAGMMKSTIGRAIEVQSESKMAQEMFADFAPGAAGKYGGAVFTAEQLNNAAIIASVGKSMGMSRRDLIIGLMTAMQESRLRNLNYGDRDSLGLFQQRPSMNWGTPEQVTNPRYAATKFFDALKGIKDRDSMSLTAAAQAVQRSAYPNAYAQWEDEARAILSAMTYIPGQGFAPGTGQRTHPTKGVGALTRGIHGDPPAVDIGLPTGKGIYAVRSGVVTTSRDLRGYEPRAPHGGLGYRSYGRYIVLSHDGGGSSLYAHLSQRYAREGQRVKAGARIGLSGDTGYSKGPHLHFGAYGSSPYDFLSLSKGAQNIKFDNTIANLHKGEAVLTEDINKKFRQGVDNFANGGGATYNLNVNVEGTSATADEIANKVMTSLKKIERRKPQARRAR